MTKPHPAQMPLFPATSGITVGEACALEFAAQFRARCAAASPQRALPREADEMVLACLLLADANGASFTPTGVAQFHAAMQAVSGRLWFDQLPWKIVLDCCAGKRTPGTPLAHMPLAFTEFGSLSVNLDHHSSNIRAWMFDVAWFVRRRLDADEGAARLLKDVADTLGYSDRALGLCRSLFDSDESFWTAAEQFQPATHADQYRERIDIAKKEGLALFGAYFEQLELAVRRRIDAVSLGLRVDDHVTS